MLTAVRHGLPAALADRLTDEARASFAEAPRDARFKLLCQALSVTEAVLLDELAKASGSKYSMNPPSIPKALRCSQHASPRSPKSSRLSCPAPKRVAST